MVLGSKRGGNASATVAPVNSGNPIRRKFQSCRTLGGPHPDHHPAGAEWLRRHVTGRLPDYALLMVVGIAALGALGFLLRLN